MECQDIMKTDVEMCRIDDTVETAARKMKDRGVGFLPVCNERGLPMGVITDRDIVLRLVAEGLDSARSVVDVMTLEVVSCKRTDDITVAEQAMAHNHKSRILVLSDDGAVCGVISLSDIAQHRNADDAGETLREISEREATP